MSDKTQLAQRLDRFASALHSRLGFSGVIGASIGDTAIFERAYGLADSVTPNTTNTRFSIASVSKQFTAYAVLALQRRRSIRITDAAEDYVPELKGKAAGKATILELLNHTSGLPAYFSPFTILRAQLDSSYGWTSEDVIELVSTYDRLGPRGKFVYSDIGYELLRALIERVTGKSWSDVLREVAFERYGLARTDIHVPAQKASETAAGYVAFLNPFTALPLSRVRMPAWNYSLAYGASGIYATAGDLLRWGRAVNPQHRELYGDIEHGDAEEYVAGWIKRRSRGNVPYYFHPGAVPGFNAAYYRVPQSAIVIVVLSNSNVANSGFDYALELLHLVLGEDYSQPKEE